MYKVVQTGPKTQLGGLKLGKIISEYHGSLKEEVTKLPIPEAKKVIIDTEIENLILPVMDEGDGLLAEEIFRLPDVLSAKI